MNESLIITVVVPENTLNDRLDRWLAGYLTAQKDNLNDDASISKPPILSRSRLKNMILDGNATIGGKIMRDPSGQVHAGDTIILTIPPTVAAIPEAQDIPLEVLFEDDHIIVINKPAGLVTHPAPGTPDGTLVNALIAHCGVGLTGIGGERRPGIVHRLDKDTSGVMMAAKTAEAHTVLTDMFAAHDLDRVYTALVWGLPMVRQQTVNAPIGRSHRDRKKMAVSEKGRHAITHLNFIRGIPPLASLAECRLETGRTHQIRVHMAHIGHSIIGDVNYGRPMRSGQMPDNALRAALHDLRQFKRQALHASLLGFKHPITGAAMEFTTPLPDDMQNLINGLENAIKARGHL
ncbi:MAG: RluA family pseudouridine synthase [Candidatus Puniceispirillales bacterium WSBS_2018_MAG_OTU23]